jgi:hypothetical protein
MMLVPNRLTGPWCARFWIRVVAIFVAALASAVPAAADIVTATWATNPEPDIAGYRLSYGTAPAQYTTTIDVGNVTSQQVTLNPGARYFFVVRAYNTIGLTSAPSAEASIDLTTVNRPPTLTQPPNQSGAENSVVSFQILAADPDANPLIYTAAGLPSSLAINSASGLITGTLSYTSAGTYTATVTVSDGLLATSASFGWTVTNVNRTPTLGSIPSQTTAENATVSLQLTASDPDGQALTFSAIGLPPGLAINAATGLVSGTLSYSTAGTYSVTAMVSDGSTSVSRTFTWTVTNVNRAPTLTAIANQSSSENTSVSLQLSASDPDGGTLSYSASGLPQGASVNSTTGLISGLLSYSSAGTHAVTATASDGGLSSSRTFTWTVANVNRAPTLSPVGDQNSPANGTASLQLIGGDPDGQSLVYGATGLPPNLTINSATGVISGTLTASSAGSYFVTAMVSDGSLSASTPFNWTVTSSNRGPTLTAVPNQTHSINSTVSLQLTGSDPDGQPLSYAASGLPAGLTIDGVTGLISGTLTSSSAGVHPVTASASDGTSTASVTFTWTVLTNKRSDLTRAADFDGDGRSDMVMYRPSTGEWFVRSSRSEFALVQVLRLGAQSDRPVPGSYDADANADAAIYRSGTWMILPSTSGYAAPTNLSLGRKTDRPVPGDYDGDGTTDLAVFRTSNGTWQIQYSSNGYATTTSTRLGGSSDRLVQADYDGDGRTDIAIVNKMGLWSILLSRTGARFEGTWGRSTDMAVPGDYDGDGAADVAFYRPSTGGWHVLQSSSNFTVETIVINGSATDVPVPGDYDGDGKTDFGVFRTSTATWFILKSSSLNTTSITVTGGAATDVPVPVHP